MGKKPHVRETKPGKKVNRRRGETATARHSSVSRNGFTVRPTMHFGVPSFFLEPEVVPETEVENSQEGRLLTPPAAGREEGIEAAMNQRQSAEILRRGQEIPDQTHDDVEEASLAVQPELLRQEEEESMQDIMAELKQHREQKKLGTPPVVAPPPQPTSINGETARHEQPGGLDDPHTSLQAEMQRQMTELQTQWQTQWQAQKSTWETERASLAAQLAALEKSKIQAEQDREFIREQYAHASAYVTTVRDENKELEQRVQIAEAQSTKGVELIKATFESRVTKLQDDGAGLAKDGGIYDREGYADERRCPSARCRGGRTPGALHATKDGSDGKAIK